VTVPPLATPLPLSTDSAVKYFINQRRYVNNDTVCKALCAECRVLASD